MSEPDENITFPLKSKFLMEQRDTTATTMDLDLVDLDASWPLDQFPYVSNPMSPPFLFSSASAELPCSPLWTFQNDFVESPRFLSLNAEDPVRETDKENDDRKRSLPTHIGLTPMESNGSCVIKERMTQALRYFKESTEQHVLAQVWAPVKNGGRFVLTTSGQPFVLDPRCNGLNQYRMVSLTYMFSVDGTSDGEELGLPGRVFKRKLPEWTPNVQYYSSREFSRLDHALHYNVRGTLALPVFEPSGQSCVGVVELILTSEKINYATEVDQVCKALEAVNLKSSEILDHPNTQICNEGRHNALAEISEILTMICEMHKLPLAQTWVPCRHRSVLAYGGGLKKSCSSFDGSCMGKVCMSTSDVAFYVVDAHIWGFREACAEHHLQLGQGVAGKAFSSHNSFFCSDITKFSKTEYPLVHYARLFGLTSCFAICLRSTYTGNDDYILEFFLPPSITDCRDQQTLLDTLLRTMNQHFKSLKIISRKELDDEKSIEIIKASIDDDNQLESKLDSIKISSSLMIGTGALNGRRSVTKNGALSSENKQGIKKTLKKRGKAEKSISLEVLQQYFAGSLKDAAKSLGVCPTTMKRICRQHGISRWPSRKINKVNRSLSKLKLVIESVQGGDSSFALNSLSSSPLAVGSISWHSRNESNHQPESPEFKPFTPRREKIASPTCNTPESDGHAEKSGFISESVNVTKKIKKKNGSGEESAGSPTSHGSCQGTPTNEITVAKDSYNLSGRDHCLSMRGSVEGATQSTEKLNLLAQESFGAILVEDAGSSKDLRNLCPSAADAIVEERVPEFHWTNPPFPDFAPKQPTPTMAWEARNMTVKQEMTTVTIKATYREDIIRFKIALSSSIVELREEVGKRLKLEVGTFDIKYLDDDHEWVLIACNADFKECMDISRTSGSNMIRLSIHDLMSNFGSSCESTGGGF